MVLVDQNPYYFAAIGGVLLGIATTLNYVLRGRVTGMSGMIYGVLTLHKQDLHEKLGIIGGMLVASGVFFNSFGYGSSNNLTPFGPAGQITAQTSYVGYALAGLLVGFGTKLSNGCTSGHGLCGLARLSLRSLVAVAIFLSTGIAVSTIRIHASLGPFSAESLNPAFEYNHTVSANVCIAIGALLPLLGAYIKSSVDEKATNRDLFVEQGITFLVGAIFGSGLLVAGMVRRSNILGFLGLGSEWNPSLLFVLGCGVIINIVSFNYMLRIKKESLLGRHLFNPANKTIDWKLMLGAACFGLGWGIGGLCPGPALIQLSVFTLPVHVIWFGCMLFGMTLSRKLEHYLHQEQQREKTQIKAKEEQQSKAHHLHHHKHPHPHPHHHHQHNHHSSDSILPPIKVKPQENVEFNPIVDFVKQQSGGSLKMTAVQSVFDTTNIFKADSDMQNPTKPQ